MAVWHNSSQRNLNVNQLWISRTVLLPWCHFFFVILVSSYYLECRCEPEGQLPCDHEATKSRKKDLGLLTFALLAMEEKPTPTWSNHYGNIRCSWTSFSKSHETCSSRAIWSFWVFIHILKVITSTNKKKQLNFERKKLISISHLFFPVCEP